MKERWMLCFTALAALMLSTDAQGVLAKPCYLEGWGACVETETQLVSGKVVRSSEVQLRAKRSWLRTQCEDYADPSACVVVGIMQASGVGGSTDLVGSEVSLWRACELDPDSCVPIASALASGNHVAKDNGLARSILQVGGVRNVVFVGDDDEETAPPDPWVEDRVSGGMLRGDAYAMKGVGLAIVFDTYVEDCALGIAEACAKAGVMTDQGAGTRQNDRGAYNYFRRACDLDRSLCMDIAQAYDEGKRVEQDLDYPDTFRKLAMQEGEADCRYGEADRCVTLGHAYLQGQRVWRDEEYAAVLFAEACEGGESTGCTGLAGLRWSGEGIAKDRKKAVELYGTACKGGDGAACWKLGRLFMRGEQMQQDTKRAEELFKRACDLGDQAGCDYTENKP